MSSVWTFRLKRRKRFSIDSPSCDRTSAKSASRNAEIRCVPSVPYKAWPDTLQPIHGSFCNEHPYVHGNELRTASMTRTDAGMYSCAGLSRRCTEIFHYRAHCLVSLNSAPFHTMMSGDRRE